MSKIINFKEAIRKGIIKEGDYINPIDCFQPGNREVLLKKEMTGFEHDQLFCREEKYLKWIYSKDYQGNPIIVSSITFFNLGLKGKAGHQNMQKLFDQIASVYSNKSFNINARVLNQKDGKHLLKKTYLDKIIERDGRRVWLENADYSEMNSFGIDTMGFDEETMFKGVTYKGKYNIETSYLYNPILCIECNEALFGICIVIPINDLNVFVDLNSMEISKEWKLIVPEKCNKHFASQEEFQ